MFFNEKGKHNQAHMEPLYEQINKQLEKGQKKENGFQVAGPIKTLSAKGIKDFNVILDIVELIMALAEQYDTEIADEVAEKMSTVKDVVEYINNNK